MHIKLTPEQAQWLIYMTETTHPQQAVDELQRLLLEEGVDPKNFMHYLKRMMVKQLPPGQGE